MICFLLKLFSKAGLWWFEEDNHHHHHHHLYFSGLKEPSSFSSFCCFGGGKWKLILIDGALPTVQRGKGPVSLHVFSLLCLSRLSQIHLLVFLKFFFWFLLKVVTLIVSSPRRMITLWRIISLIHSKKNQSSYQSSFLFCFDKNELWMYLNGRFKISNVLGLAAKCLHFLRLFETFHHLYR